MRFDSTFNIDPVSRSAGAALLFATLAQWLASRDSQTEIWSELLAWLLLPLVYRAVRAPPEKLIPTTKGADEKNPSFSTLLWLVAFCIGVSCHARYEKDMAASLSALAPLVLISHKYSEFKTVSSNDSPSWLSRPLYGAAATILTAVGTLDNWSFWCIALSSTPALVLSALAILVLPKGYQSYNGKHERPLMIEGAIDPLAIRMAMILLAILALQTLTIGFPACALGHTIVLGFVKSFAWYFTLQTIRHAPWCVAAVLVAFAVVTVREPFLQSSTMLTLWHLASPVLSLNRVVSLLYEQARDRPLLYVFILPLLVMVLSNIFAIQQAQALAPSFSKGQVHPADDLIKHARLDFENMIKGQSSSLVAASDEYRRRYGIAPPPGFAAWYEYAKSHDSPIIDDYDIIYDAVSPFWKLSGQEIQIVMRDVYSNLGSDLWFCSFSGANATTTCHHPIRKFDRHLGFAVDKLFKNMKGALPDVDFAFNHIDEPRVLIPPSSDGKPPKPQFDLKVMSRNPTWDEVTKYCTPPAQKNERLEEDVTKFGLPFVANRSFAMDICQHPEYKNLYGLFMSPTSFRLIEGSVPILSTGAPSTMGDIIFPSPAYLEDEFQYIEANDVKWSKKRNNLYWAGSTTGGVANGDGWRLFHRQRFVTLAQNLDAKPKYYLREKEGAIALTETSFLDGRRWDVAFTRIFQADQQALREQKAFFKTGHWQHKDAALRSRLVFDLDGNGISGRWYKLLASRSTPLKQTLLREWHDERLIPWVHYVPVSLGMEELPELVFWLTSTERGQERAREIAEAGREWMGKALREVDMTVYIYRLFLELARLQDPTREAYLS